MACPKNQNKFNKCKIKGCNNNLKRNGTYCTRCGYYIYHLRNKNKYKDIGIDKIEEVVAEKIAHMPKITEINTQNRLLQGVFPKHLKKFLPRINEKIMSEKISKWFLNNYLG